MAKESQGGLTDRLVPILLFASIGLAFIVGVLWQKVNNLEGGTSTTNKQVAGTGNDSGDTGNQQAPSEPSVLDDLPGIAESVGVDKEKFQSCVDAKKYSQKVEDVYQGGVSSGITGTPGSIVMNQKGEAWLIPGALPFDDVKVIIQAAKGDTTVAATGKMTADQVAKIPKVTQSDHIRGSENPAVYLIEYSDYQCPYCTNFHPTAKQVIEEFSDVAWVYRHFPLDQIHPLARPAAEASECVFEIGGEDAFWKFSDKVYGV